jgi:glyoxylase-like metal-dependent hydrolase (beta-lactamase superfamily II)
MNTRKVSAGLFIVDLKPANIGRFTAAYILKGEKTVIIECGPASTAENLLRGLKELKVGFDEADYVMVSHAHIDHWGSACVLLEHLPNANSLYIPWDFLIWLILKNCGCGQNKCSAKLLKSLANQPRFQPSG